MSFRHKSHVWQEGKSLFAITLKSSIGMKGSKQGACSSNTQPAKGGCLYHNRRDEESKKVPGYVNTQLSYLNHTVFEDTSIANRATIAPLIKQAERLYTEKTGQKCQRRFTPFRESVLVINDNVTDEQLMDAVHRMEKRTGWRCLGVWVHKDEGHKDEDGNWKPNLHAHVLWSCQNLETGKAIPATLAKLQGMQDDLAAATGMERGNKTGKRHLNVIEQRIKAQEDRIMNLEQTIHEKGEEAAEAKREAGDLHRDLYLTKMQRRMDNQSSYEKKAADLLGNVFELYKRSAEVIDDWQHSRDRKDYDIQIIASAINTMVALGLAKDAKDAGEQLWQKGHADVSYLYSGAWSDDAHESVRQVASGVQNLHEQQSRGRSI